MLDYTYSNERSCVERSNVRNNCENPYLAGFFSPAPPRHRATALPAPSAIDNQHRQLSECQTVT